MSACEHTRELAAELALGIADGAERGRALQHLADCPGCRGRVDELAETADELLLLAPSREAPVGFETRVLERLRPPRRRRLAPRARRMLEPALAAAAAVAITLAVVGDDLRTASEYRGTLSEANGREFRAGSLYADGERAGTAFGYRGDPSWLLLVVDPAYRAGVTGAELVTTDGARVPMRPFALDPASGSWGRAIPVDLAEVAVIRLPRAGGAPLVARLGE